MLRKSIILAHVRRLCRTLPGAAETVKWDHPTFCVEGKIFATVAEHEGRPCMCVKAGKDRQRELIRDGRYAVAPYVGRFGWVLYFPQKAADLQEATSLVLGSFRLIAPRRILRAMDEPLATKRHSNASASRRRRRT